MNNHQGDLTPEEWAKLEAVREEWIPFANVILPTEPGHYVDNQGDPWYLNANGTWTDKHGMTKPKEWNWILVASAPFERTQNR